MIFTNRNMLLTGTKQTDWMDPLFPVVLLLLNSVFMKRPCDLPAQVQVQIHPRFRVKPGSPAGNSKQFPPTHHEGPEISPQVILPVSMGNLNVALEESAKPKLFCTLEHFICSLLFSDVWTTFFSEPSQSYWEHTVSTDFGSAGGCEEPPPRFTEETNIR